MRNLSRKMLNSLASAHGTAAGSRADPASLQGPNNFTSQCSPLNRCLEIPMPDWNEWLRETLTPGNQSPLKLSITQHTLNYTYYHLFVENPSLGFLQLSSASSTHHTALTVPAG